MHYTVKRGYSYVNPKTGAVTLAGDEVVDQEIDKTQMWKLVPPGGLVQKPKPVPIVKKQTFDEATAALVAHREKITEDRRNNRTAKEQLDIEKAKKAAAKVKSDKLRVRPSVEPDDYIDPLDEGEET